MTQDQINIATECAQLSAAGKITFGEVVGKLIAAGFERYHADYPRAETTYYLPDGTSHAVLWSHAAPSIGTEFSAKVIEASVRQSQRGEIKYEQFVKQTTAAGCVGYFVQITGQRVQYFGRNGDIHTEWFPGATKK